MAYILLCFFGVYFPYATRTITPAHLSLELTTALHSRNNFCPLSPLLPQLMLYHLLYVQYLHIPCLVPQQDKEPKEQSSIHLLVSHSFQQLDNVYTVCSLALQYIRAVQNGCYDTQGALPQVYWCLRIP